MRGGAIPLLGWAAGLSLSGALNAIWTGDLIQTGTFTAAILMVTTTALLLVRRGPDAARRGEPDPRSAPEAIPRASFAAAFTAAGIGVLGFGLAFGHFPIYFGAGMIVAGLGGLGREQHAQRRALAQATAPGSEAKADAQ